MKNPLSQIKSRMAQERFVAIKDLGHSKADDSSSLQALIEALQDTEPANRAEAARSLGMIGGPAVDVLISALRHNDIMVRREAAVSLGKVGPAAKPAAPLLAGMLKDADLKVRMSAATSLGQIGAGAAEAIPVLVQALQDSNLIFCRLVSQALGQIGRASVPALIDALRNDDKNVRREAAWALGQIGPDAGSAIPALAELLHGKGSGSPSAATKDTKSAPADSQATEVIDLRAIKADETQLMPPPPGMGMPDADAKVRQAAIQALERIQSKKPGSGVH